MAEYLFRIAESFSPRSIPMARLAEYMAEYAKLLGEAGSVHFTALVDASVGLAAEVEPASEARVFSRVTAVGLGGGPDDARRAASRLDDMLATDNAVGQLLLDGAQIIPFPGKNRPLPVTFGPFTQDGSLEGEIVRIEGTDDSIHVTLRDGGVVYSKCVTDKAVARRMGEFVLGPIVRAHGVGKWLRHADGTWELKSFKIRDFDILEEGSLAEVVGRLRKVPGNAWGEVESPLETILRERGSEDGDANH